MKSDVAVTDKEKIQPYKGLNPYSEDDADNFFGRTTDIQRIVNSLLAWRLTVLYGESGVGKSSVLRAGVIHALREEAKQNLEDYGVPKLAVVIFPPLDGNWEGDPLTSLTKHIEEEITKEMGNIFFPIRIPEPELSFIEMLKAWTEVLGGEDFDGWLFIILDQFEQYFQYHPQEESEGGFIAQFAEALNQPNLHVNFLISLREDFYVNLNRLRRSIPSILDICLQIKHLDKDAAREAIEKPIEQYYNKLPGREQSVEIEQKLVDALLKAIPQSKQTSENAKGGVDKHQSIWENQISAPYLQLVMFRLWSEMEKAGSHCLNLQTLISLGDNNTSDEEKKITTAITNIVKQHVTEKMEALSDRERDIAARSFQELVAPSGTKYAYYIDDLAKRVNCDLQELKNLLEKLSEGRQRIMQRLSSSSDRVDVDRYEIFHDFLASAVLEWQTQYVAKKEREEQQRREREEKREREENKRQKRRAILFSSLSILFVGLFLFGLSIQQYQEKLDNMTKEAKEIDRTFQSGEQLSALRQVVKLGRQVEKDIWISDPISQIFFSFSQKEKLNKQVNRTFQKILSRIQPVNEISPPKVSPDDQFFFSPDGKTLAVSSIDGTVRLWNRQKTKQDLDQFFKASGSVSSLSFSPDGKTLAISSIDGTVRLWNRQKTKQDLDQFFKASGSVSSLSFSPDGKTLAVGSTKDNSVFIERRTIYRSLQDMLNQGCEWLKPYLQSHPDEKKEELGCP